MTITIKALLTAPLLDSTFTAVDIADVRGNVYDGLTVVGFSDTVTLTGRTISFDPSGTFSLDKLYQVELAKTTGGEVLTTRDWVWIRAASGEFLAGDPNEIAVFQTYKQGFPALERSTADTAVIEFQWPISGATFANSASTCKRIFLGETGSQEEAMSGAITAISGRAGWYKIAYNVADRAATGTTIVPTSVTYTLVDDAGNTGYLTLVIREFTSSSNGIAVLPGRDRAVADAGASTITVKLGEIITIARAVVDANGQPMDLSGFTNLQFVVQDARGLDLAKVDHADITISGGSDDTYSFVTPSGMTSKLGVFDFSLNQVGGGQIVGGKWIVLRRAVAD